MKCRKQPAFLEGKPSQIAELWEVRLPVSLWQSVRKTAQQRKKTLSTITRYCVFLLAERSSLRRRPKLAHAVAADREAYAQADKLHRHMVCLYGEDAQMLRLAAVQLRISVSCLIRIALRLFLRHFAMENHSPRYPNDAVLFWRGIKRWIAITLTAINSLSLPAFRDLRFQSYPPEYRWSWP